MAEDRTGTALEEHDEVHPAACRSSPDHKSHVPKRHARVTVKYNRKELQRRLDVEKWIDDCLDRLYSGQMWRLEVGKPGSPYKDKRPEDDMPEEVIIDDLIDLPSDEERVKKLQELFQKCSNNTESFIGELVAKLDGVQKQEELQSEGVEHPAVVAQRHEPYHFNNPHFHPHFQHSRGQNQTL